MPIASTVATVVVSSVLTTVTVQLDFDSVAVFLPPISIPTYSCWRKPGKDSLSLLFRGGPQLANAIGIQQTGGYATFIDRLIYAAATAAFISGTSLLLGQTEYIIKTNGTIGFINFSGDVTQFYAGIDVAGLAAMQPMCLFPLLGISHFATLPQDLPAALPSWAHYQPFHVFFSPQVMGPVNNPTFYSPAFATPPLFQNGIPYGVARISSFANASYQAINLAFGLTDPFLIYFKRYNVIDAAYIGSPQITPVVSWWDSGGALISTTTMAVQTFTLNVRNIGIDRDFGLAVDVDLSALTPPTTARFYSVALTAQNYANLLSYLTFSNFRRINTCNFSAPQVNLEGGGFIPGIMTDA